MQAESGRESSTLELYRSALRLRRSHPALGDGDNSFKEDAAHLLFDEARVLEGDRPADAKAFSARLAPDPDTPRSVTPCVVGFATREEERRNKVNPGVVRSASSSAPAAMLVSSADVSTVELAALGSRSVPRVAVTTIESAKFTGRSTIWTGPSPDTWISTGSNPCDDTRAVWSGAHGQAAAVGPGDHDLGIRNHRAGDVNDGAGDVPGLRRLCCCAGCGLSR